MTVRTDWERIVRDGDGGAKYLTDLIMEHRRLLTEKPTVAVVEVPVRKVSVLDDYRMRKF